LGAISARLVAATVACVAATAPGTAARQFDLTTASIADINAAFEAGALTSERLTPVGISFLGLPFSESRLLALGHAFELSRPVRKLPATTPALPGERFEY
jgi:hypothetical protein